MRKITAAGKKRVDEDAENHGADAPETIADPSEDESAASSSHEKQRRDVSDPETDGRVGLCAEQILQSRPGNQGKDALFNAVEHPTEEGSSEHEPLIRVTNPRDGMGGGC
jgi:hypothetical protein